MRSSEPLLSELMARQLSIRTMPKKTREESNIDTRPETQKKLGDGSVVASSGERRVLLLQGRWSPVRPDNTEVLVEQQICFV